MDLLRGRGAPSPGGVILHDKAKNIRDKMRYSNLSVKQEFAVVKQVDERAAHMTDTTRQQQGRN